MTQSKKIAVTGGIGSGKSTLCDILRGKGYVVFSCDEIAAELWREEDFLRALALRFPDCTEENAIDKAKLTARVFSDGAARRALEEMTHPVIMARLTEKMKGCGTVFAEVPLLFEGGYEGLFDGVIALRRAEELRIAAVKARSRLSEEEIRARIRVQTDAASLSEKTCYLIENDGSPEDLEEKAGAALRYFGIV